MIIFRNRPERGIFFAIWPRWTPDGWACLEWLHFEWVEPWGWGSNGFYKYARYIPDARYDAGERREFAGLGHPSRYATPPDPKNYCKNFRTDGPTPCHFPHCKRRDEDGVERCGVDGKAFGDWCL